MGNINSFFNKLFKGKAKYQILILGLANAGKTSLLYRLFFNKKIREGDLDCSDHRV